MQPNSTDTPVVKFITATVRAIVWLVVATFKLIGNLLLLLGDAGHKGGTAAKEQAPIVRERVEATAKEAVEHGLHWADTLDKKTRDRFHIERQIRNSVPANPPAPEKTPTSLVN